MDAPSSHSFGRLLKPLMKFGSNDRVKKSFPKFWLSIGPHSPFAAGLSRLHCGTKSLAMPPPAPLSVHVRVVWRFSRINGFRSISLLLAVSACTYLPTL